LTGIIFGPINQHLGRNLIKEMNYSVEHHFQQYFSYIMMVSFIGGENRSTRENHRPVTDKKKKVKNVFNK
jgi:hypothetical protein